METEPINNSANRPVTPPGQPVVKKETGPSTNSGGAVPQGPRQPEPDMVTLSSEGRRALEEVETTGSSGNTQREIQVTENKQVVLKIKDQSTDEVIKQVPSEPEVRLRQAIQDKVDSLDENI